MTINLKLMKHQMEKVGFNINNMANYADVSYSVMHSLINGKSKLENVSLKLYRSFEQLFTPTELLKAADTHTNPDQYEAFWMAMFKDALKSDDMIVDRSGAPARVPREDGGYYQTLPVYTTVKWHKVQGEPALSLRIWDQQLYRDLDGKGQKDKKEIIKSWVD